MTLKSSLWQALLMLTCHFVTGCNAQENSKVTNWQPNVALVSTTNILWGTETNHVKAGLNIQYASDSSNRTLVGFFVVLYNNSDTNGNFSSNRLFLTFPPIRSIYTMTLCDDKMNVVPKTKIGKDFGQPFDTNPKKLDSHYGQRVLFPFQLDVLPVDPIVLENYFDITNAGKYHLKFVLNTLMRTDAQGTQPFYLPVDADIEIKKP